LKIENWADSCFKNAPPTKVRQDTGKPWYDDSGILNVGLIDFLLDPSFAD